MKLADYGAKALVFSQFVNFLDVITTFSSAHLTSSDLRASNPKRGNELFQTSRILVSGRS